MTDDLKSRFVACLQDGARDLDLSGLELPVTPPQVESNTKLATLVRLSLAFNRLSTFPELQQLTKLAILHMAGNALASIAGASFASISRLRELTLNGNALASLPADLGLFTKLERLDVSNNRLRSLPNEIGYLCSLVELRCSGNPPLSQVPRTVRSLGHLELASFDFCGLSSLPAEITYCSRLLELNLANNRLRELPRDFGRLTRLTTLNLSENQLTELPMSMGRCQALGELGAGVQLDGNPIANAQLLKARAIGPDHLMFFLEKRMQSVPGGGELFEVPWHGLIEQRELARKKSAQGSAATTIALPGVASASSSSAAAAAADESRERRDEAHRKVDALKRWAHEQINNVYQPRLRQIRAGVEKITTLEQGQALLAFMQKVAPSISEVAELLPDVELPDAPRIDASLPPVQVCRVQLQFALQTAKQTLEACEQLLVATSNMETIVAMVRALKNVQLSGK